MSKHNNLFNSFNQRPDDLKLLDNGLFLLIAKSSHVYFYIEIDIHNTLS